MAGESPISGSDSSFGILLGQKPNRVYWFHFVFIVFQLTTSRLDFRSLATIKAVLILNSEKVMKVNDLNGNA